MNRFLGLTAAAIVCASAGIAAAQDAPMSFFITSVSPGKGGDFGGLAGADAYCDKLAVAAGSTGRTWKAYLSTSAENAKDRIGTGPWHNAKGVLIAKDLETLHKDPVIFVQTALTEKGEQVNGSGTSPNQHDILTGSQADGTAFPAGQDRTCGDYSKSGDEGSVMLGHHDRTGPTRFASPTQTSWNAAHPSAGCSVAKLRQSGSGGLLYCFAAK